MNQFLRNWRSLRLLGAFFIIWNLLSFHVKAQSSSIKINGVVIDAKGETIPGVAVRIKGSQTTTQTNLNGAYSITVPNNQAILVFSYIGFVTQEQKINNRTQINVSLKEEQTNLNEVVVIGYGAVKKGDLTGSVGQVNIADLNKAPVRSFEEALAGRVAGVQVTSQDGQPGSGIDVVIRGAGSVTQDNSPLYVIDGFPIENPDNNAINPEDIESIDVLKDASATAIYGARGANGVIIITTKGGIDGKAVINYNGYYGIQDILQEIEVLNPYEFIKYQLERQPATTTSLYLGGDKILEDYRNVEGVNWQDKLFRTTPIQSHTISIRGGNKDTKYSLSGSVFGQEGIVRGSDYDRVQGRFRLDQTVSSKFKVGINTNYSHTVRRGEQPSALSGSSNTSALMFSVWGYRPVSGNPNVDLFDEVDEDLDLQNDSRFNPILNAENRINNRKTSTLIANAYGEYAFNKYLKLRVSGGVTRETIKDEVFNGSNTFSGSPLTASGRNNGVNGSFGYGERNSYLNENILTYNRRINKDNDLSVVGGFTIQGRESTNFGARALQIPNEQLILSGLDEGIPTSITANETDFTLASFLGRVNYVFKTKYTLTASFRADGSSKFSPSNKWSYFPSAAFAWRMKNENFLKNIKQLSDAKLRISYGVTGNNRVNDFAYLSEFTLPPNNSYGFNNSIAKGSIPFRLGNPDLRWETSRQLDIGLDLGFLKDRISLTADVYRKTTVDLLLDASLPASLGFSSTFKNIGSVENKGLELTINTVNVKNKKFTWNSSFNISFNRNKVLALAQNQETLLTNIGWDNFYREIPAYIAKVGQPLGLFYGYVWDGNYQYEHFNRTASGTYELKPTVTANTLDASLVQPGDIKYKDLNGDLKIDNNDLTIIGNPNPDFIGGFSNNFTYKGFDLNIFFQYSYGNEIFNANRLIFEGGPGRPQLNQYATVINRWTPENQTNGIYRAGGDQTRAYSSRVIEDGSFIRLKTVALGYRMPKKLMERLKVNNLRLFVSAQNLYTWSNYSGFDPEVSSRNSALTPAFDYSVYPRARTITFGLNFDL
ncbi:MAG: TonB-dependent receptor [Pedobacter sp.]|uniref:SusC/RagA family TonB-linked outer membrane protein n=1 Tax=Pedobacter sp. TaxID=1411316 RepID=UPI00280A18F8|nr:TonB-dependent receptor [Pedobacter sp.]MDQ8005881.1 TonB-dependent receptor [Pedobacter sp.]